MLELNREMEREMVALANHFIIMGMENLANQTRRYFNKKSPEITTKHGTEAIHLGCSPLEKDGSIQPAVDMREVLGG